MKIAIHHRNNSFSERWIDYCEKENISYKIVNAYSSDIIQQVKECDVLLWHYHHTVYKDVITAKRILFALEHVGIQVFPDFRAGWHFDDKVAQKYLLEATNAPLVPSFVFYDKKEAIKWASNTDFPKVFKLKGGAGSSNVKLVRNKQEAEKIINKAFGKGFPQYDAISSLKERINKYKRGKGSIKDILKGFVRLFHTTEFDKLYGREKGYVYFQEFIPNNESDIRIVIVGDKALGEKRFVRKNDFRASGSGEFSYSGINTDVVELAFSITKTLNLQCMAFDFIYDQQGKPLIVEMSYGFGTKGILQAPGYWDSNLEWHKSEVDPATWIIKNIMNQDKPFL